MHNRPFGFYSLRWVVETIYRLPAVFGIFAGMLVGVVDYLSGKGGRACIADMSIAIAVFYIFGLYAKKTLFQMVYEAMQHAEKKKQEALALEARQKAEKAKEDAKNAAAGIGGNLDLKANEAKEKIAQAFQAEPVSAFIRQELQKP